MGLSFAGMSWGESREVSLLKMDGIQAATTCTKRSGAGLQALLLTASQSTRYKTELGPRNPSSSQVLSPPF